MFKAAITFIIGSGVRRSGSGLVVTKLIKVILAENVYKNCTAFLPRFLRYFR